MVILFTNEFVKKNISTNDMSNAYRIHSQSPIASHSTNTNHSIACNKQQVTSNYNQQPSYCNKCLYYGHRPNNCRQNQQNIFTYKFNYKCRFYNYNYWPQFMTPCTFRNFTNRPAYAYHPWLANNARYFD